MAVTCAQPEGTRRSKNWPREWLAHVDCAAWRRFFPVLLALTLRLFLALYANLLRESGRYVLGAAIAAIALALTGVVAVKVVPYFASRTVLDRWRMKGEYDFTREGGAYLAVIAVVAIAALNTGNNLLYIILACLLAGILVSGLSMFLPRNLPSPDFAWRT